MCYHTLYLFLTCGHGIPSLAPLAHQRSPPCPARSRALFHSPSLSSPISPAGVPPWAAVPYGETTSSDASPGAEAGDLVVCNKKLSHPLHTYRIAGLCRRCQREREERLARFEVGSIRDGVEMDGVLGASGRQRREGETLKVKTASPGLRSGYVEGRGREKGMAIRKEWEWGAAWRRA